jgi:hypothetical protein
VRNRSLGEVGGGPLGWAPEATWRRGPVSGVLVGGRTGGISICLVPVPWCRSGCLKLLLGNPGGQTTYGEPTEWLLITAQGG